ncbi:unnamed protein product [Ixodes pacificus]
MHLHHWCGSLFMPCQKHFLEVHRQTLKAKSSQTAAFSSSMITKRHSCSGFPWPQASDNHWGLGHATIHIHVQTSYDASERQLNPTRHQPVILPCIIILPCRCM